ncbi:MAG TPA: tetratricopeptide repeat protein [bacterium]|nr:tetratricopeptide repeat protein [bacterium]
MKKWTLLFLLLALHPVAGWATSPEDYYNAGMDLLTKQHDYDKAIQYFRAALDQRPDYWQAYQFLGEAYYQNANRTEAVVAMKQSLRLHPDNKGLREFLNKIEKGSPWIAADSSVSKLAIGAITLSLVTLAWTYFLSRRLTSSRKSNL